jgi:hypothetical protein
MSSVMFKGSKTPSTLRGRRVETVGLGNNLYCGSTEPQNHVDKHVPEQNFVDYICRMLHYCNSFGTPVAINYSPD